MPQQTSPFQFATWYIQRERKSQDKKWGEQNHTDERWLTIATEELGEIANAILKPSPTDPDNIKKEIIQLAAVCVAWLEAKWREEAAQIIRLKEGKWPELPDTDTNQGGNRK
jgi:NTP pyrophosphatase (non-canonical NTP hydrolase)